jgi:hypothetical protein
MDALYGPMTPELPSAWPPSLAAWAVALGGLLTLGLSAWWFSRRWRQQAWRREALQAWQQCFQNNDIVGLSRLLRRVARYRLGAEVASLGDADFAQQLRTVDAQTALRLTTAGHRPQAQLDQADWQAAKQWIRQC